jgi:hypothetical protein
MCSSLSWDSCNFYSQPADLAAEKKSELCLRDYFLPHRAKNLLRSDRQISDLQADSVIDRVGDSCGGGNSAMLANGLRLKWAWAVAISDIERLVPWNISDVGKFVFAEIGGEDLPVLFLKIFG